MSSTNLQILNESVFASKITKSYTDVISEKVGGKVLSFSDEWFAAAENLIKPTLPIRDATRFTPAGAWYDGWETRRHNTEEADWVIFKFGVASAKLIAAEVDTAFFNGNHAPDISVEACFISEESGEKLSDANWISIIPKTECGPSQRHFFVRDSITTQAFTHARLRMYPDGGIARFKLYGEVIPVFPSDLNTQLDLAHVCNGGVAVSVSDQHFGSADNLLLPGRGKDMSDGWETKRSRTKGHVDWVIVRLGSAGYIDKVVVDTAHYKGNFPQYVRIEAVSYEGPNEPAYNDPSWETIVTDQKTQAHREHFYGDDLIKTQQNKAYTHVKMTIIPDGGVKRLRVIGRLAQK